MKDRAVEKLRTVCLTLLSTLFWQTSLAAVQIEGLSSTLEANVRAFMRLDDEPCDQDQEKLRYRYQQAGAQIRNALVPFGFYAPHISSTFEPRDGGCWVARFVIDVGEPVRIAALKLEVTGEGQSLPQLQRLLESTKLKVGGVLKHAEYDRVKQQLLVLAREYGFFDARLAANRLTINPAERRAEIELVLETGRRYRFGELHIHSEHLDEDLLRRYVEFQQGAPFEQRRLRQLQNDLVAGEFFSEVEIRTETKDDYTADVILELTEGRRTRYGIGLGYGTDTGPVVRADMVVRRLNRSGHRLELETEVSQPHQSLTFNYRVPGRRPQRDWYSAYGGIARRDTDAVETVGWKTGVRMNKFHSLRLNSTPFLEWSVERFRQDGDWRDEQVVVPGYAITYLAANATDRPTRGIRLIGETAVAHDQVLSDVSFLRLRAYAKTIVPLGKRGRLLTRGEFGWMTTNNFERVPPSWRFYAGGDNSVRGYAYQALGPKDDDGRSIGGEETFAVSGEIDWRVRERWSGAVFADAGNVGKADLFTDVPWSVGFGARWYSPVGPIRVDLAFPQQGDNNFRLHISMGPDL